MILAQQLSPPANQMKGVASTREYLVIGRCALEPQEQVRRFRFRERRPVLALLNALVQLELLADVALRLVLVAHAQRLVPNLHRQVVFQVQQAHLVHDTS